MNVRNTRPSFWLTVYIQLYVPSFAYHPNHRTPEVSASYVLKFQKLLSQILRQAQSS